MKGRRKVEVQVLELWTERICVRKIIKQRAEVAKAGREVDEGWGRGA